MGIVEYRGREWRVNTAGWLAVLFLCARDRERAIVKQDLVCSASGSGLFGLG